jgi:lipid-A-disaccharide synthase
VGDGGQPRVLIVAGETSGDRHAARLVEALRAGGPCSLRGVTGPALEAAGVERIAPLDALSVIGFTAVIARLPRVLGVWRRVLAEAKHWRPHAAVLVDSPGFNLRLGPALKRLGIPVYYYIAPQVWAWHPERAAAMARWVDRLAVVFPFEERLFRDAGVEARFIGHPLMEDLAPECDEPAWRARLGLAPAAQVLALLPGSRRHELRAHVPVMVEAARRLMRERPALVPVLAAAPGYDRAAVAALGGSLEGVRVAEGLTHATQAYASACAVASGTATLETALLGTPLVIVYRTGAINHWIARRLVTLSRIGLPNIVAEEDVAPELIQRDLTPERLAATLAPWLDDPARAAEARRRLARVKARLGGPGAAARAAEWLRGMLP